MVKIITLLVGTMAVLIKMMPMIIAGFIIVAIYHMYKKFA